MMRPWDVFETLVSRFVGPRTVVDRSAPAPVARIGGAWARGPGFRIEGGGSSGRFYIWDEDRREAERWAVELADTPRPARTRTDAAPAPEPGSE